ncbi:hypothetical protein [Bradyrhizobium sp. USDA 4518]
MQKVSVVGQRERRIRVGANATRNELAETILEDSQERIQEQRGVHRDHQADHKRGSARTADAFLPKTQKLASPLWAPKSRFLEGK